VSSEVTGDDHSSPDPLLIESSPHSPGEFQGELQKLSPSVPPEATSQSIKVEKKKKKARSRSPVKDSTEKDSSSEKKPTPQQLAARQLAEEKRIKAITARMAGLNIIPSGFSWKDAHVEWEKIEDQVLKTALAGTSKVFKAHVNTVHYEGTKYADAYSHHQDGLAERALEAKKNLASKASSSSKTAVREDRKCLRHGTKKVPAKKQASKPKAKGTVKKEKGKAKEVL
jgi:hypothetical protein